MSHRFRLLAASALTFLAAAASAQELPRPNPQLAQIPDDFGVTPISILQIPASSFVTRCSGIETTYLGNGYMGLTADNSCAAGNAQLMATVTLPTGALIHFLDIYADDTSIAEDLNATLRGYSGGTNDNDGFTDITTVTSENVTGRQYKPGPLISHTVNNDVAYGAGLQYEVLVYFPTTTGLGFKGVDVWWRRQVSPAPVGATFNDVPVNHTFFQFIEALAKSGITGGCQAAPPLFCPDAPLTRGQMAVFLSKALGLSWYDASGLK